MPFYPLLGEGSPTKIDYSKKGTLILASLLEDLAEFASGKGMLSEFRAPLDFVGISFWRMQLEEGSWGEIGPMSLGSSLETSP